MLDENRGAESELQRLYHHRFPEQDLPAKARLWRVLVQSFFQHWVEPGHCVLDLGCGYGEFLNHLKCARRIGIDANSESAQRLHPGIEFHTGDITDLRVIPDGSIDMVFTSNVFEHLPSKADVERSLREALRVLKPSGQLVCMGPNLRYLAGSYWDFWDHRTAVTDRSLSEVMDAVGFRIEWRVAKFLPYTTRSLLPQWPWLVWLYLKCRPAWWLLGRQFLIRAVKP